jgi:hypothetical protein
MDSTGLHWTPVDSSGLYPKLVFGKNYVWYESRVRVKVRVKVRVRVRG